MRSSEAVTWLTQAGTNSHGQTTHKCEIPFPVFKGKTRFDLRNEDPGL